MSEDVRTAAELRRDLEAAKIPTTVIQEMISLTAPARSEQRVKQAMAAALIGTGCSVEEAEAILAAIHSDRPSDLPRAHGGDAPGDCACALAAAAAAVEAHVGTGGHAGAGGRGRCTTRDGWASGLGSGRVHAADGGAWNIAIAEASRRLSIAAGGTGGVEVYSGPGGLAVRCGATSTLMEWSPAQERAICLQAIARLLPEGHRSRIDQIPESSGIAFGGSLAAWASHLDHTCRIMAEVWIESACERDGCDLDAPGVWESARASVPPHLRPWAVAALHAVRDAQHAAHSTPAV